MQRDCSLDIARAISMSYIIGVWHLSNYTDSFSLDPYGQYVKNAALGLFMLLSGYLLGSRYMINNLGSLAQFYKKRILRIVPLFFVALFSWALMDGFALKTAFLASIGLSVFIPPQPPTLWFVSMIIIFYYLFPVFLNKATMTQFLILAALWISCFLLKTNNIIYIDRRFFYYLPCFILGVIMAKRQFLGILSIGLGLLFAVIFCALSYFLPRLAQYDMSLMNYSGRFLISICGAMVIILLSKILAKSSVASKISAPISYASMVAYMFHRQILAFIRRYVYWPEDGVERVLFIILVCLPLILCFGYIIQKLYDILIKRLNENTTITNN